MSENENKIDKKNNNVKQVKKTGSTSTKTSKVKPTSTKKTTTKSSTNKVAASNKTASNSGTKTNKTSSAAKKTDTKKPASKNSPRRSVANANSKNGKTIDSSFKKKSADSVSDNKENKTEVKKSATEIAAQAAKDAKESGRSGFSKSKSKRKATKKTEEKREAKQQKSKRKNYRERKKEKEIKDRKTRYGKRTLAVIAICLIVFAVVYGCFSIAGKTTINAGLAATVDDYEIYENDVTEYIKYNTYYAQYSKSSSSWSQFLSMYGMTASKFREQTIDDKFVHDELVRRAAADNDVTVDEAVVDKDVNNFKDKFTSDSAYQKALSDRGYTEESYRDYCYQKELEKNLIAKVITPKDPSDSDVASYINTNKTTYKDARKSSHVLFNSSDKDKAQQVLDQVKAGTLSFEDAVVQYSVDEATKNKGGDMGWDKINEPTSEYSSALSGLSAGQVYKDLVQDKNGYHIIKCTEHWETPDTISNLDGIPADIIDYGKKKKIEYDQETDLDTWLDTYKDEHGIKVDIYDMPSDVPYNVAPSNKINNVSTSSDGTTTTTE